jgi:cytochrome b561
LHAALRASAQSAAKQLVFIKHLGNTAVAWGPVSKSLHWLVVFLIIAQWVVAKYAAAQPLAGKIPPLTLHKSLGISILAITLVRLVWRWLSPGPSNRHSVRSWELTVARLSHSLLYVLAIGLPLTGWLMSSARNFPVSWFGVFQLPNLVSPDHAFFQQMSRWHHQLFLVLVVTAFLHVLGAAKHHFMDRSDVLLRMLPFAARK